MDKVGPDYFEMYSVLNTNYIVIFVISYVIHLITMK